MSTTSAPSVPSSAAPSWVTAGSGVALACALAPWTSVFTAFLPYTPVFRVLSAALLLAPVVSPVLAVVVLRATRHRPAGQARGIAWTALALALFWVAFVVLAILSFALGS